MFLRYPPLVAVVAVDDALFLLVAFAVDCLDPTKLFGRRLPRCP